MALYVYRIDDGALVSWCPGDDDPVAPPEDLAASGLATTNGLPAIDPSHVWDANQKTIVSVTPPPIPNWVPTYQFIMMFNPSEHAAIAASTDSRVQQFLMALTTVQAINLTDPTIVNGVNYLVAQGLITQANADLILSGQPSA
jgi:hypothetical protein